MTFFSAPSSGRVWWRRAWGVVALCGVLAPAQGAPPAFEEKNAGAELFHDGLVPRLQFEIPPEGMEVLRDYHQVWRQPRPERVDVQVTIREGRTTYTNVALHLKGSFSYQDIDEKPSLTLNFDRFAQDQRFHGLQKIHLNNASQDPGYLSEQLGRELFAEVGVPAPRAGHAFVRINGRDCGLYVLLEGWNKQFLRRHFPSAKGHLYDGGSGGDVTKALKVDSGEHEEDRSDLTNLVKAAREVYPSNRLAKLEKILDVERFRNFAALEVFLVHWDGYCAGAPNNYRVFHDLTRDKMVFMPHGMDQLFGVSRTTDFSITPNFNGLVAKGLMSIPDERRRYLERMKGLLTNQCSLENLHRRTDRLADRLRPALRGEPDLLRDFESWLRQWKAMMAARVASVTRQLNEPERPLAPDPEGTARLAGWRFKPSNEHPALGSRAAEAKRDLLQVRAPTGSAASGAWRTLVLLEEGHYEFSGLGRMAGVTGSPTNTGVILRVSGERSPIGLSTNENWTPLRYQFEVHGIANIELICEFRGAQGVGSFDAGTLKLRRTGRAGPARVEVVE